MQGGKKPRRFAVVQRCSQVQHHRGNKARQCREHCAACSFRVRINAPNTRMIQILEAGCKNFIVCLKTGKDTWTCE